MSTELGAQIPGLLTDYSGHIIFVAADPTFCLLKALLNEGKLNFLLFRPYCHLVATKW